jgi:hypothetical protein
LYSINTQQTTAWNDIIETHKKILEKQQEEEKNIFKKDEIFADLDEFLGEITQIEENKTIKIAFF